MRNLLLLIVFAASAFAQGTSASITGTITGTITDSSGLAIAGAEVTALDTATNVSQVVGSGPDGGYSLLFLPIGPYRVAVEAAGFKKFERARVASVVNRNMNTLLTLTPGVDTTAAATDNFGAPMQVTIINGRPNSGIGFVNYNLDGGSNTNGLRHTGNVPPNPDAIAEFQVTTNSYSADEGRADSEKQDFLLWHLLGAARADQRFPKHRDATYGDQAHRPRSQVVDQWCNTAAFSRTTQATNSFDATAERNITDAPGLKNVDMTIARSFRVGERYSLQFCGEATNAFNLVNLSNPATSAGTTATYGKVQTARPMRFAQLGLKLIF